MVDRPIGTWKARRWFMFSVAAFAMSVVYLALDKTGTTAEIAVQSSFWLLFGITAVFVGGVTVQDVVSIRSGYGPSNSNALPKEELEDDNSSPVEHTTSVDRLTSKSVTVRSKRVKKD